MERIRRTLAATCIAILSNGGALPAHAATATPFTLYWTAPGDDGMSGRAVRYDVRHSTSPVTDITFLFATPLSGAPIPSVAGKPESMLVTGLADNVAHYIMIKTVDDAGNWSTISNQYKRPARTTGREPVPQSLSFSAPWPNPSRQPVQWSYSLPAPSRVRLELFDAHGRHVRTVADAEHESGAGTLTWDLLDDHGGRVNAGLYFARARLGGGEWRSQVLVVR